MNDLLTWIASNWTEIGAAAGALYVLLSIVVRLTPTKRDDEALSAAHEFFIRASVLAPKDMNAGLISLPGALPKRDPLESRK